MFWKSISATTATTATIDCDMKTSQEWYEEVPKEYGLIIMDPDGWNRRNYEFSFNEELITKQHFIMRVMHSTCLSSIKTFFGDTDWAKK